MAEVAALEAADRDDIALSRLRCEGCGYGASCRIPPERCPMCGGSVWSIERGPRAPAGKPV